uniref:WAP four-disulfide core domain protein 1 n=1 Tax=Eptatretus burgeri TaxID=7764 RepID=A0A8C4PYJ6_EPTBU
MGCTLPCWRTKVRALRSLVLRASLERMNNQNTAATSAYFQHHDRCPPPSSGFLEDACEVETCTTHKECPGRYRCCYNGCVYTCLEPVSPPAVVDWLIQPKPRWLGRYGWLLDGPEEVLQAETCTTTEDGETPLACPTGYECFITGAGDVSHGIPNHGRCVHHRHLTYLFLEPGGTQQRYGTSKWYSIRKRLGTTGLD